MQASQRCRSCGGLFGQCAGTCLRCIHPDRSTYVHPTCARLDDARPMNMLSFRRICQTRWMARALESWSLLIEVGFVAEHITVTTGTRDSPSDVLRSRREELVSVLLALA